MIDKIVRQHLADLLLKGQAHLTAEKILQEIKPDLRNKKPADQIHSIWEEIEHIRIAQEDILRYTLDPDWQSPEWPKGYWPVEATYSDSKWHSTITGYFNDLNETVKLIHNSQIDLDQQIPHGEKGHTYLRELLLIADHNAYHLGKIVEIRKLLGNWPVL